MHFTKSLNLFIRQGSICRPVKIRKFSQLNSHFVKPLPPRLVVDEADLEENFLKGSGPGGQKINKTNSAVQLKHLPSGIVIKCQETRSRTQNRKIARRLLADQLDEIENGDQSRAALKRQAAAKKKASKAKKSRRKYRELAEKRIQMEQDTKALNEETDDSDDDLALGAIDDTRPEGDDKNITPKLDTLTQHLPP